MNRGRGLERRSWRSRCSRGSRRSQPEVQCLEGRALLTTYNVLNTGDSGPGSLRAGFQSTANVIVVPDTLSGQTITLTSGNIPITHGVTLEVQTLGDTFTVFGYGFDVTNGVTVNIQPGFTITGAATGYNAEHGNSTLTNTSFSGCGTAIMGGSGATVNVNGAVIDGSTGTLGAVYNNGATFNLGLDGSGVGTVISNASWVGFNHVLGTANLTGATIENCGSSETDQFIGDIAVGAGTVNLTNCLVTGSTGDGALVQGGKLVDKGGNTFSNNAFAGILVNNRAAANTTLTDTSSAITGNGEAGVWQSGPTTVVTLTGTQILNNGSSTTVTGATAGILVDQGGKTVLQTGTNVLGSTGFGIEWSDPGVSAASKLTLTMSTVGNTTASLTEEGDGINAVFSQTTDQFSAKTSTISQNAGDAVNVSGTPSLNTVSYTTVYNNTLVGLVNSSSKAMTIGNSIIVTNAGGDLTGSDVDGHYNVIDTGTTGFGSNNFFLASGTAAGLVALQDNGGTHGWTNAIYSSSPFDGYGASTSVGITNEDGVTTQPTSGSSAVVLSGPQVATRTNFAPAYPQPNLSSSNFIPEVTPRFTPMVIIPLALVSSALPEHPFKEFNVDYSL